MPELLDILSGGNRALSVVSTGRSRVHLERARAGILMLVCFSAYSCMVHSVDQAIQLLTSGCHRYLL